jgi:predicted flap endonuclease-1-like 5' DNA nuclease
MDFKRFFTDLFTAEISNQYSWVVLAYLLGAFLIGFITAWLYWRRKWKNVKNELAERTSELSSLRSKYDEQTSTLELKEADLKKSNLEIEELIARIRQLEEEKGQLHGDLHVSRQDLDKLNIVKGELLEQEKGYLNKLEDFDTLVLGLKTKNQNLAVQADQDTNALNELTELQGKFDELTAKLDATAKENSELKAKVTQSTALGSSHDDYNEVKANAEALTTENAKLIEQAQNNSAINEAHSDYDSIKAQLGKLNGENTDLKTQLAALASAAVISNDVLEVATPDVKETKEEKTSKAQAALQAALGSKITLATADQKDDLKLINGVGPFIEKKLNNLGIYTFEQISQFDDELSNTVTDAIEFFSGRIQRDDWVGQATNLNGEKG